MADAPVGVLVVDDHGAFRLALRELVAVCHEFTLLGEATSGEGALEAVERLSPELVIMDVRMAGIGGLEAMRRLAAVRPELAILLVSLDPPAPQLLESWPSATFLRKQSLSPRTLRAAWREHCARRPAG